jgi:hypothetical protein
VDDVQAGDQEDRQVCQYRPGYRDELADEAATDAVRGEPPGQPPPPSVTVSLVLLKRGQPREQLASCGAICSNLATIIGEQ